MSSLSITASPSKGASCSASLDLPLPGSPETTTNFLSVRVRKFQAQDLILPQVASGLRLSLAYLAEGFQILGQFGEL